ncbi:sulfatase [Paludisphaera mucosa]|uniref:Sulfatase n=1 Tax=Paludisphaera mucosa TaxID=3030827 RepID=A0ABT6F543_9BACT|nr:sulfatase [Paludisphaera mucosa]MDG3002530.1 sulfatase [Paludisphaera mucosa]
MRIFRMAVVAGFALAAAVSVRADDRPNVLFIAVDDLNHWVGHLGRNPQTSTPNIDRLAARGVRFTHAYCAAPLCNPSRAALMSGQRPSTTGVYQNPDDWRTVIPKDLTLTTAFRKAGYDVLGAGKIYHESFRRAEEWDDYLRGAGKDPQPKGDLGVGGIRFAPLDDARDEDLREWKIVDYGIEQLGKPREKPFFLAVGLHKPHMPWNVPRKYYDLHPLDSIQLPPTRPDDLDDVPPAGVRMARPRGDHKAMLESGRWKEAVQAYLAAISYADAMIGRLLDALDASPQRDKTIVVLWGDHGWHLGEKSHWRKFALWEEATRAPLIWVVPGVTKPGVACARTVDFMSLYPTLTDLCSVPTPKHVEGRSIKALLQDPAAAWDQPALTTFGARNHAVRSEGWRYIRYANGDEELYDEEADPYEWTNLAADAKYAGKKAELARWFPTTDAPPLKASAPERESD